MTEVVYSIGHSTRPLAQFIALLRAYSIHTLVDIRSIPRSRRNPQYDQVALQQAVQAAGLVYKHLTALGGRRRTREASPNTNPLRVAAIERAPSLDTHVEVPRYDDASSGSTE
jgi:uncharacterized protein (DUF488 family)